MNLIEILKGYEEKSFYCYYLGEIDINELYTYN